VIISVAASVAASNAAMIASRGGGGLISPAASLFLGVSLIPLSIAILAMVWEQMFGHHRRDIIAGLMGVTLVLLMTGLNLILLVDGMAVFK
jgi:hypothetical protein